jgi:PD-(D/E)XK endonuclease
MHKKQGDIGVGAAIGYYMSQGLTVCYPLTDTSRYDLVVDTGVSLLRVQVKTTRHEADSGFAIADLRTKGGNTSWNGEVKRITQEDCDVVFINTPYGNYELPAALVEGMATVTLGVKYKDYRLG